MGLDRFAFRVDHSVKDAHPKEVRAVKRDCITHFCINGVCLCPKFKGPAQLSQFACSPTVSYFSGMNKLKRIAVIACLVAAVSCNKDKDEVNVKCHFDGISPDYTRVVGEWQLTSFEDGDNPPQTDLNCDMIASDIRSYVAREMKITLSDYFNTRNVLCDSEENLTGVAKEEVMDGKRTMYRSMFYDGNCHPIREFYYFDIPETSTLVIYYQFQSKSLALTYTRK